MRDRARGYRETLSLLLALRSPHLYLVQDPLALEKQTDRYLRALAERGIISHRLRDLSPLLRQTDRADCGEPRVHSRR